MNRQLREFIYGKCDYNVCVESISLMNSYTDEALKQLAQKKFPDSYVDCLFGYYASPVRLIFEEKYGIDTRTFFRRKQEVAEYIAHHFDKIIYKEFGGKKQ